MNYGGSYSYGAGAGCFAVKNPVPYVSIDIGGRSIEPDMKYTLKQKIKDIFVFLFGFIVEVFLFVFILPIIIVYLIYRLGFRKTINLFKRWDREYKRRQREYNYEKENFKI